jgi:hypothetical protein
VSLTCHTRCHFWCRNRYPALSSLQASGLLQGLEELAGLLEVTLADALALLQQQPTLLLAKVRH